MQPNTAPIRPRSFLGRLACTLTGVVAAWLLVESLAMFHIADFRKSTWLSNSRFDEDLISVHRPYARDQGSAIGGAFSALYKIPASDISRYEWDLKYDRNGFRNDCDWARAEMVVLGSSYVEGTNIADSALITNLLARRLGGAVENLGHNAYGPQQELIALKRYGLPLHPRTVIWTYTDFVELQQELFYRGSTQYGSGLWSGFVDRSFTRDAYHKLNSYIKSVVAQGQQALLPNDNQVVRRSGVVRDAEGKQRRIYFLHAAEPLSREELSAFKRTMAIVGAAHELCAAQGARMVVVFIPDQFRVFHSFASFDPRSECRRWVVNEQPEILERAVRSISPDIGYLDLTPALTDAVQHGVIPYFTDDNHWSPVGHRIAADAIGDYLFQNHNPGETQQSKAFHGSAEDPVRRN
jgi:hypothetical protein